LERPLFALAMVVLVIAYQRDFRELLAPR